MKKFNLMLIALLVIGFSSCESDTRRTPLPQYMVKHEGFMLELRIAPKQLNAMIKLKMDSVYIEQTVGGYYLIAKNDTPNEGAVLKKISLQNVVSL